MSLDRQILTIDNRLNGVRSIAYGGGRLFAACNRRVVEVNVEDPERPVVVGSTVDLPKKPNALTLCNLSNKPGARMRLYDDEWFNGDPSIVGSIATVDLSVFLPNDYDRTITEGQIKAQFPQLRDINHHAIEFDFFIVADRDGDLTVNVGSDDGVRAWIDGVRVMERWQTQGSSTDEERTYRIGAVTAGKPFRWRVEYADAKATHGDIFLRWSWDFGNTWEEIPGASVRQVYRQPTRVVNGNFSGGEILPDLGAVFAVGDGILLWSYAGPGLSWQQQKLDGRANAIITTSWHRLLFHVEHRLHLRTAYAPTQDEATHELPFVPTAIIKGSGELVWVIHRDGRFALFNVSNRIDFVSQGRFEHSHDVTGGYFGWAREVKDLEFGGELLTYDEDILTWASQDPIVPSVVLVCQDGGVARYRVDDHADPQFLSLRSVRDIQHAALFHDAEEFLSTVDPRVDQQVTTGLPRLAASWQKNGFCVAHGDAGWLTHRVKDRAIGGVSFPAVPAPTLRWRMEQEDETTQVSDDGSTLLSDVPAIWSQQLRFEADPSGSARLGSLVGTPLLTAPFAVFLEFGPWPASLLTYDTVGMIWIDDVIRLRSVISSPSSVNKLLRPVVDGVQIEPAPGVTWPMPGSSYATQAMIICRTNEVVFWADGVKLHTVPGRQITGILPGRVRFNVGKTGPMPMNLNDVRIWNMDVEDRYAKIITGGLLVQGDYE